MVLRRHEQRLGSPQAATNSWTRPLGLAAAAHRGGDRCPTARRLAAICRPPGSRCAAAAGQANGRQNRPFPRRCPPTLRWQNRPLSAAVSTDRGQPRAHACAERQRLRTVSRADCRGAGARAERRRDLARPGRRPRLLRAVRECPALRRDPARRGARRGARRHHDRARRRRPGRLRRRRADGPRPEHGEVPTHAALRPDAGLLAQVGAAARVAIERADLGRAPRTRVSPAGRHRPRHRPRQSERRRPHAGHLRPRAESALSRCARALRRRRPPVPRRRSRSQREGRSRRRPRAEDAAQRPALRDARRGASVPGSLGDALGRHAHPRHDEAASRRDVCRGAARARAAPARTVSLLPVRRTHGAPRWLRRSRGRVLRRAARLDRAARPGAVE